MNSIRNQEISILDICRKIIKSKKILLYFTSIGVVISVLYHIFSEKKYELSTLIEIQGRVNPLEVRRDLSVASSLTSSKLLYLTSILKSKLITGNIVRQLNLEIEYYNGKEELYTLSPFIVSYDANIPQFINVPIFIKFIDHTRYSLQIDKTDEIQLFSFSDLKRIHLKTDFSGLKGIYNFGEHIQTKWFSFKIDLKDDVDIKEWSKANLQFKIRDYFSLIYSLLSDEEGLKCDSQNKVPNLLRISLEGQNKKKIIAILNEATKQLQNYNLNKKNLVSDKSISFVEKQIVSTLDSLKLFEIKLKAFKVSNDVLDIEVKSKYVFTKINALQSEKANIKRKLRYIEYLKDYVMESKRGTIMAPSLAGISDKGLISIHNTLTKLNEERIDKFFGTKEETPYISQIDRKMDLVKETLLHNINELYKSASITKEYIQEQLVKWNKTLSKMPATEQDLKNITRFYGVIEQQYVYLLNKHAELGLIRSSNISDISVVDKAQDFDDDYNRLSLVIKIALGFIIGIIIGIFYIFLKDFVKEVLNE